MSVENILSKLPLAPGKEHLEHLMEVDEEAFDELNKDYCFYERISVITNEDAFTEAFGFSHKPAKTGYGAHCRCTACNNHFTAGYKNSKNGESNGGIILIQGPDGVVYDGYACMEDEDALIFREDEFLECPLCGEMIFVRRASKIAKEGELYALRSQEIVNVDNYTSVMTWEWRRWFTAEGCSDGCTIPVSAVIIDEKGYLRCFYRCSDRWEEEIEETFFDGHQILYDDYSSINELKISGICDPIIPDLTGTTGEKTGLAEFIYNEGNNPVVWLLSWMENKSIEALIKSPYGKSLAYQINEIVDQNIEYDNFPTVAVADFDWVDWSFRKPHRMLGISKQALEELYEYVWSNAMYRSFDRFYKEFGVLPQDFQNLVQIYGLTTCNRLADLMTEAPKEINLEKITNYLKKQNCNNSRGAGLYLDYIDMVGFDNKELLYPKRLETAHNEAANTLEFKKTEKSKNAFKRVYAQYSQLEWTDGELSVILPRYPEELAHEGKTLHHCVGRYVEKHAGGKDIIFFVRHKRRPERSYYTLNIDFGCGKPREIQLHGYGNERHGPNKQYSHSIPPKVRAFVDRWEKEVLYPWYRTQVKAKINQKTA